MLFQVSFLQVYDYDYYQAAFNVPTKVYLCSNIMKKLLLILFFILHFSFFIVENSKAQCSICAKTAQQLGDKPAKGFNSGIVYLMLTPFAIVGFVGYKWWQNNRDI